MYPEKIILKFNEINLSDLPLVGGKGANLGEMTRAGFPIPEGFSLTTAAFERFLLANDLPEKIYGLLDGIDIDDFASVKNTGERIRTMVNGASIPLDIAESIIGAWRQAGTENFYSVRSSATAEDLPEASFAGQHDSFLNVRGEKEILEKVRGCWASLFNDRAIIYRTKNSFDHRKVELAVVIQRMVMSDCSGIAFTAEPVSGRRTWLVINAGFGLGEALVGGLITPDVYTINKKDNTIIDKKIGDKKLAIRPLAEGATFEELLGDLRFAQVLKDGEITALAGLAGKIEAHYGGQPQDIEWAFEKDRLLILQSRPITGLYPAPASPLEPEKPHIFLSFNYFQVMTDTISVFGQTLIKKTLFQADEYAGTDENAVIVSAGGRLFVDFTSLLNNRLLCKLMPKIASRILDPVFGAEIAIAAERREFLNRRNKPRTVKYILKFLPVISKIIDNIFFNEAAKVKSELMRTMESDILEDERMLKMATDFSQKLSVCEKIVGNIGPFLFRYFIPPMASGILPLKLLENFLAGRGLEYEVGQIGRGLRGNLTMDMDLSIGDMADLFLENNELLEYVSVHQERIKSDELEKIIGGSEFAKLLENFFLKYGFRGQAEIDIARPRYDEDKRLVMKIILNSLKNKQPNDHRQKQTDLALEAEKAMAKIINNVSGGFWGFFRAWFFQLLLAACRNYLPLREHPKYHIMEKFWLVKSVILEIAEAFVVSEVIAEKNDIFYLSFSEIKKSLSEHSDLRDIVNQRKTEYAGYRNLKLPRVITSEGEIIRASRNRQDFPSGAIVGTSVSAGIIEGRAKVIFDPNRETLEKGEILVARFTDPGWTLLFVNAAGLVMEVGGVMTHGSIIAREYGIPAVVGAEDATSLIKTGQRIRVNGDLGFVEILEK